MREGGSAGALGLALQTTVRLLTLNRASSTHAEYVANIQVLTSTIRQQIYLAPLDVTPRLHAESGDD